MKKKFMLIIIAIVLTFVTIGTTTFAWFSLSTTNTVEQISMSVISGAGVEATLDSTGGTPNDVSIDYSLKDWKNNISTEDINAVIGSGVELTACTTTDGEAFTRDVLNPFTADANIDYIEFVIYFKVLSNNLSSKGTAGIYLVDNNNTSTYDNIYEGTCCVSKGTSFVPKVEFYQSAGVKGTSGTYYAKDAARLSFAGSGDTTSLIDFGTDPSRGYGYEYGAISYFETRKDVELTIPDTPDYYDQTAYAHTDSTHTKAFTNLALDNELNDSIYYADNNNTLACELAYDSDDACYYGYTTLRVWLEGWDGDCFDSIYKDTLKLQLSFKLGVKKDED